jgi:hypothetical protein
MTTNPVKITIHPRPVEPKKDEEHGWSVTDFEVHRRITTRFIRKMVLPLLDSDDCRRILIRAPVKSGKREMVEYLAMRDYSHNPRRVHAFVSAFHRVADESQRGELKIHNLTVFSLRTQTQATECAKWITEQISNEKEVVLHIDECDFGSGQRQILAKIYKLVRNIEDVSIILYSATPEEVLFSDEVDDEEYNGMMNEMGISSGEWIVYDPGDKFYGPKKFLDQNLIFEAKPFFYNENGTYVLSDQGKQIVSETRANALAGNGRNIVILRLTYSDLGGSREDRKGNKAIYQFLSNYKSITDLNDFAVVVDKSDISCHTSALKEKIDWSSSDYWELKTTTKPIMIVIDQTSSRSTEWKCHDRVSAYHDFRHEVTFSTVSQAQERVNHYHGKYRGFQSIKVYGHLKTFQLSAGIIDYQTYLTQDWKMRKVDRRTSGEDDLYTIVSSSVPSEKHPLYQTAMKEDDAIRALQDIGCYSNVKVSPRVKGFVRSVPICGSEFIPCSEAEFPTIKAQLDTRFKKNFRNPFDRSRTEDLDGDKFKGYLRGKWCVMEYETLETQKGWGIGLGESRITICYNNGVLGMGLRYDTGKRETVDSLQAFKSMYKK